MPKTLQRKRKLKPWRTVARMPISISFDDLLHKLKHAGRLSPTWQACIPIALILVGLFTWTTHAAPAPTLESLDKANQELKVGIDTMWVMVAGMLVFFMNAGFCMLETGFCRQKNAVNVLSKNLIVFALSTIAFWVVGFGLMFGTSNGWIGTEGVFLLSGADNSPAVGDAYKGAYAGLNWTGVPLLAKFFFQLVFAGTAATIVSGAVAERIKFVDFLIFSVLLVGFVYPITGHWIWGSGWLQDMGFFDFAGSAAVHSVGGWAALMGAAFLGSRLGKYGKDGSIVAIPGHNMSIATLGALILWLGWFGFNPGSTMAVGNGSLIAHIAITTNTAGAFGAIAAMITAWLVLGKPDLSMIINGLLAGLVAVTAGCAFVGVVPAAIIGTIGGVLVVFAVILLDKIKIDDPVGAIPVHLVNGIWGTLAVGLFAVGPSTAEGALYATGPAAGLFMGGGFSQLWIQFVGVASIGGITVLLSSIIWIVLKAVMGIRVHADEERIGLDISEHGMEAYGGFSFDDTSDLARASKSTNYVPRGSSSQGTPSGNL
jgi:ammonium transporter, Amt family